MLCRKSRMSQSGPIASTLHGPKVKHHQQVEAYYSLKSKSETIEENVTYVQKKANRIGRKKRNDVEDNIMETSKIMREIFEKV